MPTLSLAGRDVTTLGLRVQRMPGMEDAPTRKAISYQVREAFGAHLVRLEGGGPRLQTIDLALIRDTVANRVAAADALKALCSGLVRIERDFGGSTRLTYGTLEGTPTFTTERPSRHLLTLCRLTFLCYPLWRKPCATVIGYSGSTPGFLPFETGPVAWRFDTHGSGGTRVFQVYDAWGNLRHQIILPALDTNDTISIFAARGLIWKYDGTVRSTIYGSCTVEVGAFPFALDQSYGDRERGLYPYYQVSGGFSGDAHGVLTYL